MTPDEQQKVKEEELQKALEQQERSALEQLVSDFKHSFETPSGKRSYEYLSIFCFENKTTFNASSQSTCNWNEGSREVILEIKRILNMDIEEEIRRKFKKRSKL